MVFHETAARATDSAPSRISAIRQTPRSRRVSRSRSMGTEVDSEETSERGVGNLGIRFVWKAPPVWQEIREVNLACEVWGQSKSGATEGKKRNSEVVNSRRSVTSDL
jgi:hypothetical protein